LGAVLRGVSCNQGQLITAVATVPSLFSIEAVSLRDNVLPPSRPAAAPAAGAEPAQLPEFECPVSSSVRRRRGTRYPVPQICRTSSHKAWLPTRSECLMLMIGRSCRYLGLTGRRTSGQRTYGSQSCRSWGLWTKGMWLQDRSLNSSNGRCHCWHRSHDRRGNGFSSSSSEYIDTVKQPRGLRNWQLEMC